jgi:hypothetical protein
LANLLDTVLGGGEDARNIQPLIFSQIFNYDTIPAALDIHRKQLAVLNLSLIFLSQRQNIVQAKETDRRIGK